MQEIKLSGGFGFKAFSHHDGNISGLQRRYATFKSFDTCSWNVLFIAGNNVVVFNLLSQFLCVRAGLLISFAHFLYDVMRVVFFCFCVHKALMQKSWQLSSLNTSTVEWLTSERVHEEVWTFLCVSTERRRSPPLTSAAYRITVLVNQTDIKLNTAQQCWVYGRALSFADLWHWTLAQWLQPNLLFLSWSLSLGWLSGAGCISALSFRHLLVSYSLNGYDNVRGFKCEPIRRGSL